MQNVKQICITYFITKGGELIKILNKLYISNKLTEFI